MSYRIYRKMLSFASICLCLFLLPSPSEGKCSGQWSLQACLGGNGKRSGLDSYRKADAAVDSLFLRQLLQPDAREEDFQDVGDQEDVLSADTWPYQEKINYDNQSPRQDVMYQLQHILGRLKKTRALRNEVYGDVL